MPSNLVKINDSIKYEVPDSFMPPLMAYLKMVKEKTRIKRKGRKVQGAPLRTYLKRAKQRTKKAKGGNKT